MKRIRYVLIMLWALYSVPSNAQVSVNIGINLPAYPEFVVVPGYPVYYAPQLEANFFFYDGAYWIYQDDNWYESSWYNGPWAFVEPEFVPVFILRIPVFYYRRPPVYFHGWRPDAPPRWDEHWGRDWEQHRRGWDKWDRGIHHEPAPLPLYQRHYFGDRYPRQVERQHELDQKNYHYQPRDPFVRQHRQGPTEQLRPVQPGIIRAPEARGMMPPEIRHPAPHQQDNSTAPRASHRGGAREQGAAPDSPQQEHAAIQHHRQQPPVDAARREQQTQRSQGGETRQQDREPRQQDSDAERAARRGQGQGRDRERDR